MVIIIESVNFLISIERKMMVSHAHKYLDPLQILHHRKVPLVFIKKTLFSHSLFFNSGAKLACIVGLTLVLGGPYNMADDQID